MGQKPTREEVVDFTVRAALNFSAEFIATGALVFVGCLTCVHGGNNEMAAAFGFGLVMAIEIAVNISGGHVNPMATIACVVCGYVTVPMAFIYIIGQLLGSIIGFGLVLALPPFEMLRANNSKGPCLVQPLENMHVSEAFFFEFIGSSLWVLVFISQWDPRHKGAREGASIKLGLTLYALILALAPYTGGSMNPARALGPALMNNQWSHLWIYWASAVLAGIIWPLIYSKIIIKFSAFRNELVEENINQERKRSKLDRERERERENERERARRERGEKEREPRRTEADNA